jgi:hypothetical protein
MKVRLTRKLAPRMDGVDLNDADVGDVLNLTDAEARILIAEGWATDRERRRLASDPEQGDRRTHPAPPLDDDPAEEDSGAGC